MNHWLEERDFIQTRLLLRKRLPSLQDKTTSIIRKQSTHWNRSAITVRLTPASMAILATRVLTVELSHCWIICFSTMSSSNGVFKVSECLGFGCSCHLLSQDFWSFLETKELMVLAGARHHKKESSSSIYRHILLGSSTCKSISVKIRHLGTSKYPPTFL